MQTASPLHVRETTSYNLFLLFCSILHPHHQSLGRTIIHSCSVQWRIHLEISQLVSDALCYQLWKQFRIWPCCRVELCTQDGRTLKAFSLTECRGGPHEFRGIRRSELLEGLRDALPPEILHFGRPISDVTPDVNGDSASAISVGSFTMKLHCIRCGLPVLRVYLQVLSSWEACGMPPRELLHFGLPTSW